jgi:hypothetical protein
MFVFLERDGELQLVYLLGLVWNLTLECRDCVVGLVRMILAVSLSIIEKCGTLNYGDK